MNQHKIFTAKQGDIILSRKNNKLFQVWENIVNGKEATEHLAGTRAYVSAHRIMDNGQVLTNTTVCLDQQWTHYRGPEVCLH